MANKLKKSTVSNTSAEARKQKKGAANKPVGKANGVASFRKDQNERVDLRKLAKDERTSKIIGTLSLLISTKFLFGMLNAGLSCQIK